MYKKCRKLIKNYRKVGDKLAKMRKKNYRIMLKKVSKNNQNSLIIFKNRLKTIKECKMSKESRKSIGNRVKMF